MNTGIQSLINDRPLGVRAVPRRSLKFSIDQQRSCLGMINATTLDDLHKDDYYRYVYDAFYMEFQRLKWRPWQRFFHTVFKTFQSPTIIIILRAKYNKCTKFISRYKLAVEFARYLLSTSLDLSKIYSVPPVTNKRINQRKLFEQDSFFFHRWQERKSITGMTSRKRLAMT